MVSLHTHLAWAAKLKRAYCAALVGMAGVVCAEPGTNALLADWLTAQSGIQTWSADFTQTRTLKSFAQPLTTSGRVWFAAPNRFRWQIGNPPQTIALRNASDLMVIYPKLKRAEKYSLDDKGAGQWKDTLALLDAGFPRDRQELESRFKIEAVRVETNRCEVVLQPKSATARKMMPRVSVTFDTLSLVLTATELEFADGSTMRNDFQNATANDPIEPAMFKPALDAAFTVVEPLKRR